MQKIGKLPPALDKQYVRNWGLKLGIDKLDPKSAEQVALAHSYSVPDEVVQMTARIYRYFFWRLTGKALEDFQIADLGIFMERPKRRIEIILGSESDLPQLVQALELLCNQRAADYRVSACSCHRTTTELFEFLSTDGRKADVIIAGAGKAAALPEIVKARLCQQGDSHIPVIGVACKGETEQDDLAAKTSIECLPGTPVELDENGHAYFGRQGFIDACMAATWHEFLPRSIEIKKRKELIESAGWKN
jgi:phosphoribosylcarboxyaminoimidazole (NCAIR) mutase